MADFRKKLLEVATTKLVVRGCEEMTSGPLPFVRMSLCTVMPGPQTSVLGILGVVLPTSAFFDQTIQILSFQTDSPPENVLRQLVEKGEIRGGPHFGSTIGFSRRLGGEWTDVSPLDPFLLQHLSSVSSLIPYYVNTEWRGHADEEAMLCLMNKRLEGLLAQSNAEFARIGIPYYKAPSR